MAEDVLSLFTGDGFNITNLSKSVYSIKKSVDPTLDCLPIHEATLSSGITIYYHDLIEVIHKMLKSPSLTEGML